MQRNTNKQIKWNKFYEIIIIFQTMARRSMTGSIFSQYVTAQYVLLHAAPVCNVSSMRLMEHLEQINRVELKHFDRMQLIKLVWGQRAQLEWTH